MQKKLQYCKLFTAITDCDTPRNTCSKCPLLAQLAELVV